MKKRLSILLVLLTAAAVTACSSSADGGSARLKIDTDSVAYVIGMNVGWNLMQMDSTLNVAAVCEGIRDAFRERTRMTAEEAETFFLRYMNYALPEKARAYEEQFLADLAKSSRTLARTRSGITYAVAEIGDQERIPSSDRDSIVIRMRVRSTDEKELYSSYERGDSLRMVLSDLPAGLVESLKLIGEGGKIESWVASSLAFGAEGNADYGISPNQTACFDIELLKLDKFSEWNRRKNSREKR